MTPCDMLIFTKLDLVSVSREIRVVWLERRDMSKNTSTKMSSLDYVEVNG